MRESNTRFYVSHINLSKLVNLLTSALHSLLSFPSHRCTRSSSLSRPSLTSRLKISNRSFYHSAPVLWNNLPSYLRQVVHHVTPSPISNSPVSDLFFLEVKNPSPSLFLSSLVCIHLGYLCVMLNITVLLRAITTGYRLGVIEGASRR